MMPASQAERIPLDIAWVRAQFPALKQTVNGHVAAFLDGPGGTQVPERVMDAITNYLKCSNANTGGAYATSRRTDAMILEARCAMADFLGADAEEIVFGPNMTTLTYAFSRALGRRLGPGDEIVVTVLDHDANISPWRVLEERGVTLRFVDIDDSDCTLDMEDLVRKINQHTRVVAVGLASNAVGTINDVKSIVRLAHQAGALVFVDAVHYAPHHSIDVRDLACDFLVCSTYKFFGPHMGVLYGRREHLKALQPDKVRANSDAIPNRWEWGTLNHELIAGITACVEYLADLGRHTQALFLDRRAALLAAYDAIHQYERSLAERLLSGLLAIPRLKVYGIVDRKRLDHRCPTVAMRAEAHTPLELATRLGEQGVFAWDGNYYALHLTERLNVENSGGFLRIGLVHYNTAEDVDRVVAALNQIASR